MTDDDALAAFELLAQSQQPASVPWQPVTDYSFEARQKVEGRQPALILSTFRPQRILDVGAGAGHLVRLLNERAGHSVAFGADVRDTTDYQFDLTEPDPPNIGGDLVICREVLEHLTVLQIVKAVRNLVTLSSRYVYVTTRFAPANAGLLTLLTSDDLDPTHITMLPKAFLRLLFVLEGCTARPDLEAAMDWQHKGRCLVYEVPHE